MPKTWLDEIAAAQVYDEAEFDHLKTIAIKCREVRAAQKEYYATSRETPELKKEKLEASKRLERELDKLLNQAPPTGQGTLV